MKQLLFTIIFGLRQLFPYRLNTLMRFMQLQLFITLCSWPILLYWGLPLSLASPLGNFIFGPFISAFLVLSSFIFFCELFSLPNSLAITLLEALTVCWTSIISWASRSWLLCIAQPTLLVALAIPAIACIILHHKKYSSAQYIYKSVLILGIFTLLTMIFLKYAGYQVYNSIQVISKCMKGTLTLITTNKQNILIDTGALAQKINAKDFVVYTLMPQFIKNGTTDINGIIELKPSASAFKALTELCKRLPIKVIYIPLWQGIMAYSGWRSWEDLLAIAYYYDISICSIDKDQNLIVFNEPQSNILVKISSSKAKMNKTSLRYPFCTVTAQLDSREYNFAL